MVVEVSGEEGFEGHCTTIETLRGFFKYIFFKLRFNLLILSRRFDDF